jgi:hypothetical protein
MTRRPFTLRRSASLAASSTALGSACIRYHSVAEPYGPPTCPYMSVHSDSRRWGSSESCPGPPRAERARPQAQLLGVPQDLPMGRTDNHHRPYASRAAYVARAGEPARQPKQMLSGPSSPGPAGWNHRAHGRPLPPGRRQPWGGGGRVLDTARPAGGVPGAKPPLESWPAPSQKMVRSWMEVVEGRTPCRVVEAGQPACRPRSSRRQSACPAPRRARSAADSYCPMCAIGRFCSAATTVGQSSDQVTTHTVTSTPLPQRMFGHGFPRASRRSGGSGRRQGARGLIPRHGERLQGALRGPGLVARTCW